MTDSNEGPQVARWIANFADGTSLTSKDVDDDFLNLSFEQRSKIVAMRLEVSPGDYATITRKVRDELVPGLFYHIKIGRIRDVMGSRSVIPYLEERLCFCYNRQGDAVGIMIDHHNYLHKLRLREQKIRHLLCAQEIVNVEHQMQIATIEKRKQLAGQLKILKQDKDVMATVDRFPTVTAIQQEIKRLVDLPIIYNAKVIPMCENIINRPFNHDLFNFPVTRQDNIAVAMKGLPENGIKPRVFCDNDIVIEDFTPRIT